MPRAVRRTRPIALAAVLLLSSLALPAAADGPTPTRSDCVAASLAGQRARAAGHLTAAKDSFSTCGDASCPALIRNDCTRWTDELVSTLPSVVLGAQDADGHDLRDVEVMVDGRVLGSAVAGQAVPMDPGTHLVRYQRANGAGVEQEFVVREGDRARPLVLKFPVSGDASSAAKAPPDASGSTTKENLIVGATVGVGGLALVGVGVYFFSQQSSETTAIQNMCAGGACRTGTPAAASVSSQVSTVNTNRGLSGASLGVGAAAIGTGLYFIIARPLGHANASTATALRALELVPTRGGSVVGYHLSF